MPTLEKFMKYVKAGKIRDNVQQAGGWLILLGSKEYNTTEPGGEPSNWKCGSIEPCPPEKHGDIAYLYVLDLDKKTINNKYALTGHREIN